MENETKNLLMQYLGRVADHFKIEDHNLVTFKKRAELFEKVREKDSNAATVLENLFSTFIKEDRIQNDKEKFDKARVLWEAEHAAAEHEKVEAERLFVRFCKDNNIPIGSLSISA